MKESVKIAFATDDGVHFHPGHFGDARGYFIFEVSAEGALKVEEIPNTSVEEQENDSHGDVKKAKSITQLMKAQGVSVLVNRQFGPNIVRIRKQFVPVIISTDDLEKGVDLIRENIEKIQKALNSRDETSGDYPIVKL